ncbi:hypothetical protein QF006_000057 [Pantoea agglomerans]|jgi:hypothetical protein|nr:hypothetical protein [Pantoea agglomerans]
MRVKPFIYFGVIPYTKRVELQILVAMSLVCGEHKRRPSELRISVLKASLHALCHYSNPLNNRVGASLATMNICCGQNKEKKRFSII